MKTATTLKTATTPTTRLVSSSLVMFALALAAPRAAFAAPAAKTPSEAEAAAQMIEAALQRHGADVHRCFEKALADRLDVGGRLDVEIKVGEGGRVAKARVLPQGKEAPSAPLAECVLTAAPAWRIDGIEPGSTVQLPFTFQGQANQFVVKVADIPDRGPGTGKPKGTAAVGPARQPPFTVKVLADQANMRTQQVSLTLLSVGPASRVAMHRHPRSAKALYLLRGNARLLGPAGTDPVKIDQGTAVFVPAGYPHVIENMGRQSTAVFLQAFAPPGPERVYRNPADPQGRADFEVIRDPKGVTPPGPDAGRLVARSSSEAEALPFLGGKVTARILLEQSVTGSAALALDVLEFAPGTEAPRHTHPGAAEILYVVSGGGQLIVGSESYPFGPEEVLHIPADQPHGGKFSPTEKTIAIQIYAPAGAEQRFRGAPTPTTTTATPK